MGKYFTCDGKTYRVGGDGRRVYESRIDMDAGYIKNGIFYDNYMNSKADLNGHYVTHPFSSSIIGQKLGFDWTNNKSNEHVPDVDPIDGLIAITKLAAKGIILTAKGTWWTADKIREGISKGMDKGIDKLEKYVDTKEMEREVLIRNLDKKAKEEDKSGFILLKSNFGCEAYYWDTKKFEVFDKINIVKGQKSEMTQYKIDKKGNVIDKNTGEVLYYIDSEGTVIKNNKKKEIAGVQIGKPILKNKLDDKRIKEERSLL